MNKFYVTLFKSRTSTLILVFGIALALGCRKETPADQNFLSVKGHHIVNGKGDTVLLRGMGLGGWMLQEGYMFHLGFIGQQYRIRAHIEELVGKEETDKFYSNWLATHTRRIDIDSIAAWGFNSIRLPMHYDLYTLAVADEPVAGKNTWLEHGFAMADSLLEWCRANKMYLILDLHAAPGGQGNDLNISDRNPEKPSFWQDKANRDKTIALWKKLAERYADEEWIGGYDLLNETNWGFEDSTDFRGTSEKGNVPLREFLVEATRAIREVDKKHIIYLEGNGFANNYNGIFPKWDENLVLSFHKYGNFNTKDAIKRFLDLREQHNIPLWLGESGENSNNWFTEAIRLCEENGIGWAWWQNKKMGINQPLEIKRPDGYDNLLAYWQGKGPKPAREEVVKLLGSWIENLKLENNIVRRDVIDAMFRQIGSHEAIPYVHHRIVSGARIAAVDYDLGRQRVAYFDTDSASYHFTPGVNTMGNRGWTYRNDGVDIQKDASGYHVFHIENGEWLQYTVDVQEEGIDSIGLEVASSTAKGNITISIDGKNVATVPVGPTGGDQHWKVVTTKLPVLKKGKNILKIGFEGGGYNFRAVTF